jgi:alkylation response protein AidB-like acyl-CoA dehydrogenase
MTADKNQDFELTAEQRAWQLKARAFADAELRPISLQRDRIADPRETFDWDIIRKGSRLGLRTAVLPRAWGGHGIDFVTQALVMIELARGDSAITKTFTQCWKFSHLIDAICTPEQKERIIKPFVADDCFLFGTGGTEPNAGSDNRLPPDSDPRAGWKLRAERRGDEWILNGDKCFIANGSVASLFFVHARTNPEVGIRDGTTLFMVPKDTPGFRIGKVFNKRGWRFYQNAELIFENARVPHANLVGRLNEGVKARSADSSDFGDIELAAIALGVCDAAVEMAMTRAQAPTRRGKPLLDQQMVQRKLVEMHMLTEALRAYVMRVARERDRRVADTTNNLLVMNYSSEIVQRVTLLNLEIHGPDGRTMNEGADKLARDGVIWTHLAGDSVQRIKVMRRLLK